MTANRRASLTNSEGRAKIARLRRRLDHLKKRIDEDPTRSFDVAEHSALEWAIGRIERFAAISRALRRARRGL